MKFWHLVSFNLWARRKSIRERLIRIYTIKREAYLFALMGNLIFNLSITHSKK